MRLFSLKSERNGMRRAGVKKQSSRRFCASDLCEALESRVLLSGLAPTTIAGDSITFYATGGTGNDTPPGVLRIVVASSGTGYTGIDLITDTAVPSGTYVYTVNTNPNDAKLVATNSTTVYTLQLAFTASGTGTYTYSEAHGTQSGVFNLLTSPVPVWAPTSVSNDYFTFTATASGGSFSSPASYSVLLPASGDNYTLTPISGSIAAESGTYLWDKTANAGGAIGYDDTATSLEGYIHLSFMSANSGLFYNTDDFGTNGNGDFAEGTFTVQAFATTVVTSMLNPAVQGASVTLKATVTPDSGNGSTPTGTVTFRDGGTALGSPVAINSSGVASYVTSTLALGTHSITATYTGDSNFTGSTSVAFSQFITLTHSQNQAYVSQMYEDVLGRAADPTGLTNWTNELDAGTPLEQVALGLSSSLEYYNKLVTSYYQTYLGRAPDTNGLNYWANQMTLGVSGPAILVGIVSSQEYINDSNKGGTPTPTTFITALYQAFLDRAPDTPGLDNWIAIYNANGANGPVVVASGFVYALETYDDIVTGYYQTYLLRSPTSGELTTYTNQLIGGVSEQMVIAEILALPEFLTANNIT